MMQTHFTATGTYLSRLPMVAAILLLIAAGMPQRCIAQNRHPQIFVGSAFGLNQMLNRSQWPYVAANADGFYNHTWGWSPPRIFPNHYPLFTAADQERLAANFAHKSALLEGGLDSSQPSVPTSEAGTHWDHDTVQEMAKLGMNTPIVIVDDILPDKAITPTPTVFTEQWQTFCNNNATNRYAPGMVSYVLTAEWAIEPTGPITAAGWEWLRQDILASHCGGMGFDGPVNFYAPTDPVFRGAKYVQTVHDTIRWVQQNGRKFVYLASPINDSPSERWLQDFKENVQGLEDSDAEPDFYGIETYCLNPAKDGPNVALTPEKNTDGSPANTITGAAYYALKHRDGAPGTLTLAAALVDRLPGAPERALAWPAPGRQAHYALTLRNTSHWLDYAALLHASRVNDRKGFTIRFEINGEDVTSAVLGNGYVFYKKLRLQPTSDQQVDVYLKTPSAGRTRRRSDPVPTVKIMLLPHSGSAPLATLAVGAK